jgi:hypothetical protein
MDQEGRAESEINCSRWSIHCSANYTSGSNFPWRATFRGAAFLGEQLSGEQLSRIPSIKCIAFISIITFNVSSTMKYKLLMFY